MPISRRSFLKQALFGGATALTIPWLAASPAQSRTQREEISGRLSVTNTHTDESLLIRYLDADGKWIPDALWRLNHLFRCHYSDRVKPIDPDLFLLMDRIHTRLGAGRRPLNLISGYRSPEYNRLLMSKGRGVVKRSYHLKGMAADIQIRGVSLTGLCREAKQIQGGGVGLYSEFVHVDIGPVRCW
ncbi:MAG: DUF882 domain-containing protein [Deltaproteobacteria bacterium]|nr:DUF882 domain-containing protein [Deltaproteobacteria bacterium]